MIPNKLQLDLDLIDLPARATKIAQNEQSMMFGGVRKYCFEVNADADPWKRDWKNNENCKGQCDNSNLRYDNGRYFYEGASRIVCECCWK